MPTEKKLSFGQKVVASVFAIGVSAQMAMAQYPDELTMPDIEKGAFLMVGTAILSALAVLWAVRKAISLASRG